MRRIVALAAFRHPRPIDAPDVRKSAGFSARSRAASEAGPLLPGCSVLPHAAPYRVGHRLRQIGQDGAFAGRDENIGDHSRLELFTDLLRKFRRLHRDFDLIVRLMRGLIAKRISGNRKNLADGDGSRAGLE